MSVPMRGCAKTQGSHATPASRAFGGAPDGATKRGGRREEEKVKEKEEKMENAVTVSAKRGHNTTGCLGTNNYNY
eukprot:5103388-Pyramimonas_sp.AAC.1